MSHEQVVGGLLGAVVVRDPDRRADLDTVGLVHTYAGRRTINGRTGDTRLPLGPGRTARVRVVNTDNGAATAWVTGGDYRVVAVDGTDVNRSGCRARPGCGGAGGRAGRPRAHRPLTTARQCGWTSRAPGSSIGPADALAPAVTRRPAERVDLLQLRRSAGARLP